MIAAMLAVAVAAVWLAAIGLVRLRSAADRLHLVAFANAAGFVPLLIAAALADGATARVWKIVAIVAINLVSGAAGSHAIGQALRRRGEAA